MRAKFKLVAINAAVLLSLLLTTNLMFGLALDFRYDWYRLSRDRDPRVELPNYPDKAKAKIIFEESQIMPRKYKPFVAWTRREFKGRAVTINREGDRVHRAKSKKPVAIVRFFGGSTVWGTGSDDEGTLPAYFNRLFPDYRVLNHGESGFTSRQSLARLVDIASTGQPTDLAVFYSGANDVAVYCRRNVPLDAHALHVKMVEMIEPSSRAINFFIGNTREFIKKLMIEKKSGESSRSSCQDDPGYVERVALHLVEAWRIGNQIVSQRGGRFIALLQPVAYLQGPYRDHISVSITSSAARDYQLVYDAIRREVHRLELDWFYDFSDTFDIDEPIFIDGVHVSERGNQLIAERLAVELRSWVPTRRAGQKEPYQNDDPA